MLFTRLAFFLRDFSVWIFYLVINFYFRQVDDEIYSAFIYGILYQIEIDDRIIIETYL